MFNKEQSNPCFNGGTCLVQYNSNDPDEYVCICTNLFEGNHCQHGKGTVNTRLIELFRDRMLLQQQFHFLIMKFLHYVFTFVINKFI